ncbi:NADH kinase [Mercurialis annua]|uniref:NADH kinase n=1 Tax=Mercurialis annua TaxID=3986 RepID=UPI00215E319D|nr:NADH kinase [Mercurialis annua]
MAIRRLLLLLKPFDVYAVGSKSLPRITNSQVLHYLDNRRKVHKDAVNFCQNILRQKSVDWETILRTDLSQPIRDFDLVVTVGGDGTLLRASHFIDDSIPVVGVNSDPTQAEEVAHLSCEFDATRSTGHLCAATVKNFEQVLDDILAGCKNPCNLTRMSVSINSQPPVSTYALNDMLIAHPCPSTVSRFSFKLEKDSESCSPLANCRSSGLRISTAAGSTAAMHSAGGFVMPILSEDLQYMVREPILGGAGNGISNLMHGIIKQDESMEARWFCDEGVVYIDGSHVRHFIQYGDTLQFSSKAPILKVFLPNHILS